MHDQKIHALATIGNDDDDDNVSVTAGDDDDTYSDAGDDQNFSAVAEEDDNVQDTGAQEIFMILPRSWKTMMILRLCVIFYSGLSCDRKRR